MNKQDVTSKNSPEVDYHLSFKEFMRGLVGMPIALGFVISCILGLILLGGQAYYKELMNARPASRTALMELPACEKMVAKQRLNEGVVILKGDIDRLKEKCSEPVESLDEQAAVLANSSR